MRTRWCFSASNSEPQLVKLPVRVVTEPLAITPELRPLGFTLWLSTEMFWKAFANSVKDRVPRRRDERGTPRMSRRQLRGAKRAPSPMHSSTEQSLLIRRNAVSYVNTPLCLRKEFRTSRLVDSDSDVDARTRTSLTSIQVNP
jgi:hypothetical protein